MAKAPTSVSIAKIHGNPAIGAAAAQIVALINSRPVSPRKDEIAAIIASVATSGSSSPAGEMSAAGAPAPVIDGHLEEWCRVVGEFLAKINSGDVNMKDKETAELHDRVIATSIAIWARPVRSWNDILMRAMVAGYWTLKAISRSLRATRQCLSTSAASPTSCGALWILAAYRLIAMGACSQCSREMAASLRCRQARSTAGKLRR